LVLTDSGENIPGLAEEMERSALSIGRHLAGDSDQTEGLRPCESRWRNDRHYTPVLRSKSHDEQFI